MDWIYSLFLALYFVALVYITFYCLLQLNLLFYYKKYKNRAAVSKGNVADEELPFVTIQLPIYNELYVVDRLIDNIIKMDYPKDKFEIHILDDSTDETLEAVRKKVDEYKAKGYLIEQVTREVRQGYKAGALRDAMSAANGDLMAIFDADFLPRAEFLRKTVQHFSHPEVGIVQTRWEHINEDYSILTKLQALQLNVHFTIEQSGRTRGECFSQFNGTAGVWRRECIEAAGGWQPDTLTEDLDLSYRAQLKGWKVVYLEGVGSPAELPVDMHGLKSQQFRWMKGGAETAMKIIPSILRSSVSIKEKIHAVGHLMASSVFLFIFLAAVLSVPLLYGFKQMAFNAHYLGVFLLGLIAMGPVYYYANVRILHKEQTYSKSLFKFLVLFPIFLSLSMGLSLHNSIAIIQGYIGKKSAFIRTPKFDIKGLSDSFNKSKYRNYKIEWTTLFEGLLCLYFIYGIASGFYLEDYTFVIFHSMLAIGYGTIFYYSIKHLSFK